VRGSCEDGRSEKVDIEILTTDRDSDFEGLHV